MPIKETDNRKIQRTLEVGYGDVYDAIKDLVEEEAGIDLDDMDLVTMEFYGGRKPIPQSFRVAPDDRPDDLDWDRSGALRIHVEDTVEEE